MRSLDDAAQSPYAIVESSRFDNALKDCANRDGTCVANPNHTEFALYNAAAEQLADVGNGLAYDSLGRTCAGRTCTTAYIARSSNTTECRDGAPSCSVASRITVRYSLSKIERNREILLSEESRNIGAIECGDGMALTGFTNGKADCFPLAIALVNSGGITANTTGSSNNATGSSNNTTAPSTNPCAGGTSPGNSSATATGPGGAANSNAVGGNTSSGATVSPIAGGGTMSASCGVATSTGGPATSTGNSTASSTGPASTGPSAAAPVAASTVGIGYAAASEIPSCSNSTGVIPVNATTREATPRPPQGSTTWNHWLQTFWWAGNGDIKNPRPCMNIAYQYDLYCHRRFAPLLSHPNNLICTDPGDGVGGDQPLLEFDTSTCTARYIGCRGNIGCLTPDSKILMADGIERRIDSLKAGDVVYNPKLGRGQRIKRITDGVERIPLVHVHLNNGSMIKVTQLHPMLTQTGLKLAKNLRLVDSLPMADGSMQRIRKIVAAHGFDGYVWNIELEGEPLIDHHVIIADGVQTGDLFLQENFALLKKQESLKVARDVNQKELILEHAFDDIR